MTANLLTLNPSKTEFLLIGLKNQLAKILNSSLDTFHSARNLGFIFVKHLTSLTKLDYLQSVFILSACSRSRRRREDFAL